jgi:hypothetical protein
MSYKFGGRKLEGNDDYVLIHMRLREEEKCRRVAMKE